MKYLMSVWLFFLPCLAFSHVPVQKLTDEMNRAITSLTKFDGWSSYIKDHPKLFNLSSPNYVGTDDLQIKIDDSIYDIALGARSVRIAAKPKTIVSIVDNPHFFKSLYGLDKPADTFPIEKDGSYKARIFKLVPGIETQDYILSYQSHWEGTSWLGRAQQEEDEKGFALRDNLKIITPDGEGSIYREVALFYPMRWWLRLFHGTLQNVTKKEMAKLNVAIKCAGELAEKKGSMTNEIAEQCHKEAEK